MDKQNGFTLVELAIVMIIIGLLIGGILKGQQLIENARVAEIIQTVKNTQSAMNTFRDIYRRLPGDSNTAVNTVPGCTAASFCLNGDNNNRIGTPYAGSDSLGAKFYTDSETVQFWKHLALADLISGVNGSADPSAPEWGVTHPKAPGGGGWEIYYEQGGLFGSQGQFLRMTSMGLSPTGRDDEGRGALSPRMADAIEAKMDDGMPTTGSVIIWDYGNFGCDNLLDGSVGIDRTITNRSCVAFFLMNKGY